MQNQDKAVLFQEIAEKHQAIFFKVARTYCQDEEERQDLVQEILLQVWQALPKYNEQFKMSTWLYRISLNVAISFYRKNAVRKSKTSPLTEQSATLPETDRTEKDQALHLLEQFINELKELDKALILLYLEDRSHAEIAEILGISLSNVSTKAARIKDKLKQRFSQHNF